MTAHEFGQEPADQRGSTATEYAVLLGFIATAIIVGVTLFGTALDGWYVSLARDVAAMLGAA